MADSLHTCSGVSAAELSTLLNLISGTDISELDITSGSTRVRLRRPAVIAAQADVAPSTQEEQYVARAMIWRGLDALPPRRRAALVLYELEGTTIPAIAALLSRTGGAGSR